MKYVFVVMKGLAQASGGGVTAFPSHEAGGRRRHTRLLLVSFIDSGTGSLQHQLLLQVQERFALAFSQVAHVSGLWYVFGVTEGVS